MSNTINSHTNLTLNRSHLQVKLNLSTEVYFEDDGKVELVRNLVERMNLNKLKNSYSRVGRKPAIDPIIMLQVLIYCYSEGIYSSRKIEKACKYDLRIRYLLEEQKAPDHATINRFRKRLEVFLQEILFENTKILIEEGHLDLSSLYLDGTKIEAYANKYTFVWKKSIVKYQEKLRQKIVHKFNLDPSTNLQLARKHLFLAFHEISEDVKTVEFVYGKGKRKTSLQKDYELYTDWLEKLNNYTKHLDIMGERNSYSKTDPSATFMRMKEDHMRNGQLKAAYNVQLASSGQFIVGAYGSHHPNDVYTLPLFLEELLPNYKKYLDRIVCDSGYESIENYSYLKKNKLTPFIKPSNYEISKKRKYKNDISRRENMIYEEKRDYYLCANGKKLNRQKDITRTRKSGFKETLKVYKCFECNHCPYQKECNKYSKKENPQTKSLIFNEDFIRFREESYKNIVSNDGMDERINRSVQAEGMFSKMKEGLNYQRFRHRGLNAVLSDIQLLSLGMNLNQLHRKLLKNQTEIIKYKKAS